MIKSGLIVGAAMLVLAVLTGLVSPLCTICVAILAGLAAGYLACMFDRPGTEGTIQRGAIAGAIAGGLSVIGQVIAGLINASVVDPAFFNEMFGQDVLTRDTLWLYQLGGAVCIGLFNTILMAGLGAAGALIWRQTQASKPPIVPPTTGYPQ